MGHKYPNVLIHYVFSTKERNDLIPANLQPKLWKYYVGIGKNTGIPVLAAGGIANHAHLLIALPTDVTVAKAIQVMKANSSRWIGEHGIDFGWQEGYGAFSVSASNRDAVVQYIEHQPEHHARRNFECTRHLRAGLSHAAPRALRQWSDKRHRNARSAMRAER